MIDVLITISLLVVPHFTTVQYVYLGNNADIYQRPFETESRFKLNPSNSTVNQNLTVEFMLMDHGSSEANRVLEYCILGHEESNLK